MSVNDKRWIVLLVAVLTIAVILIVVLISNNREDNTTNPEQQQEETQLNEEKYTVELDNGLKVNISEEFTKTRNFGELEISNIQYTYADGMSLLLADVTNKGTTTHEKEIVKITIIGENDEIITEINPVLGKVEPGETIKLDAYINADLANAKDFRIESMD